MKRLTPVIVSVLSLVILAADPAMANITTNQRRAWGPGCTPASQLVRVRFASGASMTVNVGMAEAFSALAITFQSFGYSPRPQDTGAYNCRTITDGQGVSLHGLGLAGDVTWQLNARGAPRGDIRRVPGMVAAIKAIRTNSGAQVFRWGGDFRPPAFIDDMHFEGIQPPWVMATGINWATVARGGAPVPAPIFRPGVPLRPSLPGVIGGPRVPTVSACRVTHRHQVVHRHPGGRRHVHIVRHVHRCRTVVHIHRVRHRHRGGRVHVHLVRHSHRRLVRS